MSDQPTPTLDSSEARWERIERTLDRSAEQQRATAHAQRESDRRAEQHRADFDLFQRTMAAVIESLDRTNRRLDENLAMLSRIVADH